jgi:hypothetical protein
MIFTASLSSHLENQENNQSAILRPFNKNYLFIITQPDNIWWGGPLIFDTVFGHSTWQYSVGRAFDI